MNIRLTGLLIPAVLVGCASQTPPEESAALVYLDGLIARSAETISVAQLTLNQTGPQPQRPASPIAVPSSTQKVVSPPSQSASVALPALSHVRFTGRPGITGFPATTAWVRNITVKQAAQNAVPAGWEVRWTSGTQNISQQRVNMSFNDRWPRVLNNLMAAKSVCATVEWDHSRVTVAPSCVQPTLFRGS